MAITNPHPELLGYIYDKFQTFDIPTEEEYYNTFQVLYPHGYEVANVAQLYTDWIQPTGLLPAGKWFYIASQKMLIQTSQYTDNQDIGGSGNWNNIGYFLAEYNGVGQVGAAPGSPDGKHPEKIRWKFENLGDGTLDAIRVLQRWDNRGNDVSIDPNNGSYDSINNFPWGYPSIEGNIVYNADFLFTDLDTLITVPLSDPSAIPTMNLVTMYRNRIENSAVITTNRNGITLTACHIGDSATVTSTPSDNDIIIGTIFSSATSCDFGPNSIINLTGFVLTSSIFGIKSKLINGTDRTTPNDHRYTITMIECNIGDNCIFWPTFISIFTTTTFYNNTMRRGYNDFEQLYLQTNIGSSWADIHDSDLEYNNVVTLDNSIDLSRFSYVGIIKLAGGANTVGAVNIRTDSPIAFGNGTRVLRIAAPNSGPLTSSVILDATTGSSTPSPNIHMDAGSYNVDVASKNWLEFETNIFDHTDLYLKAKMYNL